MAAPQDDIAFRSQEYASQVNRDVEPARQRMQNATQGFAESVGQGVQIYQRGAMANRELQQRQQALEIEKTASASALALQQTRQKQAEYELWFTQQIHNTKAVEAQRRIVAAQARTAEAQALKVERDLAPGSEYFKEPPTLAQMDYMIATGGRIPDPSAREWKTVSPEERAAAAKRLEEDRPSVIAKSRDERMLKIAEIRVAQQSAGDDLDALAMQFEQAANIKDKAVREETMRTLREKLDTWRKQRSEAGAAEPATPEQQQAPAVGDKFYLDALRSIPGGN